MRVASFCYCFYPSLTAGNVAPAYKDINMIYITTLYLVFYLFRIPAALILSTTLREACSYLLSYKTKPYSSVNQLSTILATSAEVEKILG